MIKKWNDYFGNLIKKYNIRMSKINPIVIFIDGKDITKSIKHDLVTQCRDSFNDVFNQIVRMYAKQLNCIAILGVDEASFIIEDFSALIQFLGIKRYSSHDIVSVFSQKFFHEFNKKYKNDNVYWHCKCSNIPKGKIKSYIKYRSLTIYELNLTYFLKRKQIKDAGQIDLKIKQEKCNKYEDYQEFKKIERGLLYIGEQRVNIDSYLNNEIVKLPEVQRLEQIEYLDISQI